MKITAQFPKKLEDMIGKPVYKKEDPTDIYGKIVEYNSETGDGIIELDEEKISKSGLNPFTGQPIGISSRKVDNGE